MAAEYGAAPVETDRLLSKPNDDDHIDVGFHAPTTNTSLGISQTDEGVPSATFAGRVKEVLGDESDATLADGPFSQKKKQEMQDVMIVRKAMEKKMWEKKVVAGAQVCNLTTRWQEITDDLQDISPILFDATYTAKKMENRMKYIRDKQSKINQQSRKDSGVSEDPPTELATLLTHFIDEESAMKAKSREKRAQERNKNEGRAAAREIRDGAAAALCADANAFRQRRSIGDFAGRPTLDGRQSPISASSSFAEDEPDLGPAEAGRMKQRIESDFESESMMKYDCREGLYGEDGECKNEGGKKKRRRSPKLSPQEDGIDRLMAMLSSKRRESESLRLQRESVHNGAQAKELDDKAKAIAWEKESFVEEKLERAEERKAKFEEADKERIMKLEEAAKESMQKMMLDVETKRIAAETDRMKMMMDLLRAKKDK